MPEKADGAPAKKRSAAKRATRAVKRVALAAPSIVVPTLVQPLSGHQSTLTTAIGWFLGAMSLLSINTDLKWVTLEKGLQSWITDYSTLVNVITHFLFGWINWRWIKVTPTEGHVLVIATIVALSVIRAGYKSVVRREDTAATSLAFALMMIFPAVLIAVLVPDPYSVLGGGLWLALTGGAALFAERNTDTPLSLADAKEVRIELAGIVGVAFIMVAMSRFFEK